jgi:ribosomal protein S18 acetylase RimI-like enzyme
VAVESADGRPLGSVTLAPPGSAFNEVAEAGEAEVRMLAVSPSAQGRGVGEALMRHCVSRARGLGLSALALSTQPGMLGAHRIYERLGFERTPDRDWSPVPGIELITYRLDLAQDG